MKTLRQLCRQPIKSLIGIVLMTLAAAIVCLCVGQAIAAEDTKQTLNRSFSTVGIPIVQEDLDGNVQDSSFLLEDEFVAWLEKTAQEHPDIVKQFSQHGILSAYIPELTPLNITQEQYQSSGIYSSYQSYPSTMPYNCAMLVITLDEIGEPAPATYTYTVENLTREDFDDVSDYYEWLYVSPDTEKVTAVTGYQVTLSGTVTEVVSLADGYRNPVGRIARLTYFVHTLEEAEALELVSGEQYVVYGMNYVDGHWKLVGTLNSNGKYDHLDLEMYDSEKFRYLTEKELEKYAAYAQLNPNGAHMKDWVAVYDGIHLNKEQVSQLNAISLTLWGSPSLIQYEEIRDEETGRLLELIPKTEVSYTDGKGETVTCSFEEYAQRYQIPAIAKLDSDIEAFLSSEAGAPWKTALQTAQINNQAFAVMGVDSMDYLAVFAFHRAWVVEGRDFTEEERKGGSRVCIIHETVAEANGLKVGDTITLNLYENSYGLPYQKFRSDGFGILNPSASYYFDTTSFAETAEYTIVGIWRGLTLWPNLATVSEYAFSPNTVFVPQSSVETAMETCNSILFNTVVTHNGKLEDFHQLTMDAGYAGRFRYNDQGYSEIAANFHNYESLAKQMLVIGGVLYVVLLLLYLLLYPGAQRKAVGTMQSMGAGYLRRWGYVLASSLALVIPASVLGGLLGNLLWGGMVKALQTTAESALALQIEPGVLTRIAGAQLLLALALTVFASVFVAAPRGISNRK